MTQIKRYALVLVVGLALGATAMHYLRPPVVEKVKEKQSETKKTKEKETRTVKEKFPDGTERETTVITETEDKTTKKNEKESASKPVSPRTNVSLLVGMDWNDRTKAIYGGHVSRQFIGPIRLGVYGLTNGTFGASVGIDF